MKHVVITGVSRGLGRALAMGFRSAGWTVSGCATDLAALRSLRRELGPEHLFLPCDVSRPAEVGAFALSVMEFAGAPDLLLNNPV